MELEKGYATTTTISVTEMTSKRKDTILVVLPKTDHAQYVNNFIQFSTHTVEIDKSIVKKLYLNLIDHQMRGDVQIPILKPVFNYGIGLFQDMFPGRYFPLQFYPPDLNDRNQVVDLSLIPQGISLALLKPSGGITSNRIGKLLGFYRDYPETAVSGWKAVSMRMGQIDEPLIRAIYLQNHPTYNFKETGFLSLPNQNPIHGSMPDGLIVDNEIVFPIEIKRRKNKCHFDPCNIAQAIWEMACGPFPFIDLVEFLQIRVKKDDLWITDFKCREIRLYRSPEKEAKLIELCLKAEQNKNLWDTEEFVAIRKDLEQITEQVNATAKYLTVDKENIINKLEMYKNYCLEIQDDDVLTTHPIMDRIDKRQGHIFALFQENNPAKFIAETSAQIQDYAELIKNI
jgi:hypothetical protein